MPSDKPALSRPLKIYLWFTSICTFLLISFVVIGVTGSILDPDFGSEAAPVPTPTSLVLAPTPTLVPAPTPEPTLAPTAVATPTAVVIRMSGDEYEEWKKQQSQKAAATISASRRATSASNIRKVIATRDARTDAETRRSAVSTIENYRTKSHTIRSNNNIVARKRISLPSGRYKLSETSGCLGSELAKHPSDDLVLSTTIGPRSGNVASGTYMLRAIGNNCTVTLSN